jgi:microcystin-dependent protein
MTSPFLGEVRGFSFNFAPSGWALCNGQLLSISQNAALFSLLGITYGGKGVTTFALPNLQGRVANGVGGSFVQGQIAGDETVALIPSQLPTHTHIVNAAANGTANASNVPGPTVILGSGSTNQTGNPVVSIYGTTAPNTPLTPLAANGSGAAHENRMPSLVMNYCIALQGIFPSRN